MKSTKRISVNAHYRDSIFKVFAHFFLFLYGMSKENLWLVLESVAEVDICAPGLVKNLILRKRLFTI